MKITAGLGSVDEYIRFVEAGADEFFSGFVPYSWIQIKRRKAHENY